MTETVREIEFAVPCQVIAGKAKLYESMGQQGQITMRVVLFQNPDYTYTARIGSGELEWLKRYGLFLKYEEAIQFFPQMLDGRKEQYVCV